MDKNRERERQRQREEVGERVYYVHVDVICLSWHCQLTNTMCNIVLLSWDLPAPSASSSQRDYTTSSAAASMMASLFWMTFLSHTS